MQKEHFKCEEHYIQGSNSVQLYFRTITQEKARGSVVIVHGVGEHQGRYKFLENWLVEKGYNCFLYDHRGFGRSEGKKGDVASFDEYVDDLNEVYKQVSSKAHQLPIFVFGHSMGSLVVLLNLVKYPGQWNGSILTGVPLVLVSPIPKWQEMLGRKVIGILPSLYLSSKIDPSFLSHDQRVISDYNNDNLNYHQITLRWGIALIDAITKAYSSLHQISIPLFILHGEDDRISSVEGAKFLYGKVTSKHKSLITFPGLYHELHNECEADRNRVFQAISDWLACTLVKIDQ